MKRYGRFLVGLLFVAMLFSACAPKDINTKISTMSVQADTSFDAQTLEELESQAKYIVQGKFQDDATEDLQSEAGIVLYGATVSSFEITKVYKGDFEVGDVIKVDVYKRQVGTPIGNLSDFSPRAVETLEAVDFIAAEDTRVTLKLLNHFGVKKPLVSYFEHNKRDHGEKILARLEAGENCALVSDAGMPAISAVSYTHLDVYKRQDIPREACPEF